MTMSGERWRGWVEHLAVALLAGLFAAGLCFIRPTLLESSDYVVIWKPSFRFLTEAVQEGRIPLWNPYVHLGRPYLADMPNMAFYPPTYLICLGEKTGFFLQVWLHCLLAVFGMRKLAGTLGVGRWQGYLMAFTFAASGALTARWVTGQLPNCWAISYMPWLFYCAVRTAEPWCGRRVAGYAVLLALQLLCHPQVFWFSAIGQAVFITIRATGLPVRETLRAAGRGLWQFSAACVWCAGLLAVVLLPFLELVKESNRAESSPAFVNAFNLAWTDFGYLFNPLRPAGARWETNLFVGTLMVVTGIAGLGRVREPNVRGLLGVLVIGLLIALGDNTPCFGLFYHWVPGHASFRFHSRAAVLVVLVLICAAGIWLSRPHPLLRAVWACVFAVPARHVIILLVLVQSLDLLQGVWMIKRVITHGCSLAVASPLEFSFEQTLAAGLRRAGLIRPSFPPPRVCVPRALVPVNYGMIHHYSHFDAGGPLSLRRPWDYLHAARGLTATPGKGELPSEIYGLGPFPYPELNLSLGFDPRVMKLVQATNPAPRAFVVYAAEVARDYGRILRRLAKGHNIHQCALLETPPAQSLPRESRQPGGAAFIRRFEPNSLRVEVEAKETALLVLAEAWYPGWRAEIDGRIYECVPANAWMRAVPVPAGRHEVRFYFRQNWLVTGLVVTLASAGLMLAVLARSKRGGRSQPDEIEAFETPTATSTDENRRLSEAAQSFVTRLRPLPLHSRLMCTGAAGALLVGLIALMEISRVHVFRKLAEKVDVETHSARAQTLTMQRQTAQAIAEYTQALRLKPDYALALNNLAWIRATSSQAELRNGSDAVRLAERACERTMYKMPQYVGTLAAAYAEAGRFEDAIAMAGIARDLALAGGNHELARLYPGFMDRFSAGKPVREGDQH